MIITCVQHYVLAHDCSHVKHNWRPHKYAKLVISAYC